MNAYIKASSNRIPANASLAAILFLAASPIFLTAPARAQTATITTTTAPTCLALEDRCVARVKKILAATAAAGGATSTVDSQTPDATKQHVHYQNWVEHRRNHDQLDSLNNSQQLTLEVCWNSYHVARRTGTWPAHIPYNFAIPCTD